MVPCDILLISPPSIAKLRRPPRQQQVSKDGYVPPLGLCYLAAVLERAGYHVDLIDMQAENLRGTDLAHWVRERRPRVVGIGTTVVTYKNGLRIAELVKEVSPTTQIIVGGPQATFLIEETLACPAVNILVRFEGEETIVELMHHFADHGPSLDRIRGIAFRDGDHICRTDPRPLIADLDTRKLDTLGASVKGNTTLAAFYQAEAQAYDMILGDGAKVFLGSAELGAVTAMMGKLPKPAEFLKIYKEKVEPQKDKIYKYLQFDEMAEYK